jgi:hypothetical protein
LQLGQAGDRGGLQGVQLGLGVGDVAQHRVHPCPAGVGGDQQLGQPGRSQGGACGREAGGDAGRLLCLQHRCVGGGGGEDLDLGDAHRQPQPGPYRLLLHRYHRLASFECVFEV